MGIPKFFRWAAERYPMVITPCKDSPPQVDNLYLDMNGIIHNCTHPNDIDATRRAPTEKEMVQAMFAYLEKLFSAIRPRKNFLLAVDGVAPRAKMNQQRQRRYRAGYEMMMAREEAKNLGAELPDEEDVFDSNCITPGTEFMHRVSEHFQYFITMKLHQDSSWRGCNIIFSGHDDPGEGEHKIMDFIRRRKMQPDYSPNETHCMYGLDADLMMLALATHEPHFMLLREVVTFNQGSKKEKERKMEDEAKGIKEDPTLMKPDSFVLFHVNLLRQYLDVDMRQGEDFPNYDFERVVDDFVFMCFFIGNDFLPSLPTVGINDGSLTVMMKLYRELCLRKGTFLTRDAKANWNNVEPFLAALGELELETLQTRQAEEAEYQKRAQSRNPDFQAKSISTQPILNMIEYKSKFYRDKHRFEEGYAPRGVELSELRQHYVEGLQWVMDYYYQGPPSWKWFYPHHYSPLASDLVNLGNYGSRVWFDKGSPFLPHQQLLAVLPPMSAKSMPKPYWPLLTAKISPLAKYFPAQLEIDKEGARAPWEGIVLIPFIDEKVLLTAFESVQDQVDESDKIKTRLGNPIRFIFNPKVNAYSVPSSMFIPLTNVQVQRTSYSFPAINKFVPSLCKGVRIGDKGIEGYSCFYSKMHLMVPVWEVGAVNIFGMTSRKESCLFRMDSNDGVMLKAARRQLRKQQNKEDDVPTVDDFMSLVGQNVWLGYPHYRRGRVTSIRDIYTNLLAKWDHNGNFHGLDRKDHTADDIYAFKKEVETHQMLMKSKCGLVLPDIEILVHVHRHIGMRVSRSGRLVPQFSKKETVYPLQLIAPFDSLDYSQDPRFIERDRSVADYDIGSHVVYIGPSPKGFGGLDCYGATGYIMEQYEESDTYSIQLHVSTEHPQIPATLAQYASPDNWRTMHEVSDLLKISSQALSQICSSIITSGQYGSQEIGLCLKFTGKELARVGYAKQVQTHFNPWYVARPNLFQHMAGDEGAADAGYMEMDKQEKGQFHKGVGSVNASGKGQWYFSTTGIDLINEYCKKFAPLVKSIETGLASTSSVDPATFLTGPWQNRDVSEVLKEITDWLTQQDIFTKPMMRAHDEAAPSDIIASIEKVLEKTPKSVLRQIPLKRVHSRYLYFPTCRLPEGFVTPIPVPVKEQRYGLGTRVMNCQTSGTVPFGAIGTVVRLIGSGQRAEVLFDEIFVEGSRLGGRLQTNRGALARLDALLVLTHDDTDLSPSGGMLAQLSAPTPSPGVTLPKPIEANFPKVNQSPSSPFNVANWAQQHGFDSPQILKRPAEQKEATATTMMTNTSGSGAVSLSGGKKGVNVAELASKLSQEGRKSTSPMPTDDRSHGEEFKVTSIMQLKRQPAEPKKTHAQTAPLMEAGNSPVNALAKQFPKAVMGPGGLTTDQPAKKSPPPKLQALSTEDEGTIRRHPEVQHQGKQREVQQQAAPPGALTPESLRNVFSQMVSAQLQARYRQ